MGCLIQTYVRFGILLDMNACAGKTLSAVETLLFHLAIPGKSRERRV
jgi:hypothetical protein